MVKENGCDRGNQVKYIVSECFCVLARTVGRAYVHIWPFDVNRSRNPPAESPAPSAVHMGFVTVVIVESQIYWITYFRMYTSVFFIRP